MLDKIKKSYLIYIILGILFVGGIITLIVMDKYAQDDNFDVDNKVNNKVSNDEISSETVPEEDIKNIDEITEDKEEKEEKKKELISKISIDGKLLKIKSDSKLKKLFSKHKYNLDIKEENIVLNYRTKKYVAPNFTIISGSKDYVNSGDKIIFPLSKKLILKFKHKTYINNKTINSGEILHIDNVNLSPMFYEADYSVNGNTLYSKNFYKNNIKFKQKLGTNGKINIKGYERNTSKIERIRLLGYIEKDIADFRPSIGGKKYTGNVYNIDSEKYDVYDFSENIIYDESLFSVKYKNIPKDMKYKLFLTEINDYEKQKYHYSIAFETIKDLNVEVSKNLYETNHKLNNYHICLNQPLDEEKTKENLYKTIGKDKISLVFSVSDEYMDNKQNENNCLMFYYYLNPEKEYNFETNLYSLYGGDKKLTVNIGKHTLKDKYKQKNIIGNDINILPINGKWGKKIQITSKNNKYMDVYTKKCYVDKDGLIERIKNNNDYRANAYDLILSCGEPKKENIEVKDFSYWKPVLSNMDLGTSNIFKKSFGTLDNGKLFIRTNLGILTKKAYNDLHIWVNNLDDGMNTTGVNISLYSMKDGKLVENKVNNIDGYTKLKIPEGVDISYLVASKGLDTNFKMIGDKYNSIHLDDKRVNVRGKSYINKYDIMDNYRGAKFQGTKVYAYTDRVLYKPGDDIFVSGWIRDLEKQGNNQVVTSGEVSISLDRNGKIDSLKSLSLDDFGGFRGKLTIPKSADLGNYYIRVNSSVGNSYTKYIKVQEYKKSTYNVSYKMINNGEYLRIEPKYYFGQYLEKYDLSFDYSFKGKSYGKYDRDWCNDDGGYCNEPIYYNRKWDLDENYSKNYDIDDYTGGYVDIPLSGFNNKSFGNLNYEIKVIDKSSNEVVQKFFNQQKAPSYIVGFKGWSYDYIYGDNKNIKLNGKVLKSIENGNYDQEIGLNKFKNIDNDKLQIKIYQKDYKNNEEKGPDGEWYYTKGNDYKLVKSDTVDIKNGNFEYDFKDFDGGRYFIRAIYKDYEVQKIVNIYNSSYTRGYYGDRKNNLALDVSIKDKNYNPGDIMQVNINPYIKGAYAIITIEQGDDIKYTKTKILDGKAIELPVKESWYPNAYVGVSLIVGQNINKKISENREEPKFLIGYEEVKLNKSIYDLNYEVNIKDENGKEKEYFKPGEKVILDITTVDNDGVFKDARLSVGIVDKALLDIYDKLRRPMEYFYNRYGNYILNLATYKNIYKALKVFSADGEKGGGGGGESSSISNMRDKFYDLAFWRGGVYTENGKITLDTTIPDNLTTWVVDIIGITKKGQMGTFRKEFKVSKDVMLQPNLPSFVTLDDNIHIPYKIVQNKDIENLKVSSYVQIGDKKYDLIQKDNTFLLDVGKIDYDKIYKNDKLSLYMEVSGDDKVYDSLKKDIIIRKQGFILSKFLFKNDKEFEKTFELEPSSKFGTVSLNVSNLPIGAFEKAFKYLLKYPYGCTEQLMSGLYPIIVADTLSKHNLLSKDLIQEDKISLSSYRKRYYHKIDDVIQETLGKIYKNQKKDGGMGYWSHDSEKADPFLSVYVYGAFKHIENNGYKVKTDFIKNLEDYILNINNKNLLMYYYLQKSLLGEEIDTHFVKENSDSDIGKVLSFIILSLNDDNYSNDDLKYKVKNILKKDISGDNALIHGVFFNKNILKSFYIKAIDDENSQSYVMDLLENRNSRGIWHSTQENVQALLALGEYMLRQKTDENITYNISIEDKKFDGKIKENGEYIMYSFANKDKINVKVNSSKSLLYDVKVDYFPENIKDIETEKHNVDLFELGGKISNETTGGTITNRVENMEIGDNIELIGGFKLEEDAEKLAISFHIPSNLYLLNPSLTKNNDFVKFINAKSFDYTNDEKSKNRRWYKCKPDHYEVRFDRLFVYYDELKKDQLCKVIFKGVKTHNGKVNIMNSKLFEMYNTNIGANKVVK